MKTSTQTKTSSITNTKLAVATLVALAAGGVALATTPQLPSYVGDCLVMNQGKTPPTVFEPNDVGIYYARSRVGEVSGIKELTVLCSKKVYPALKQKYCVKNNVVNPVQRFVVLYDEKSEKAKQVEFFQGEQTLYYCNDNNQPSEASLKR